MKTKQEEITGYLKENDRINGWALKWSKIIASPNINMPTMLLRAAATYLDSYSTKE